MENLEEISPLRIAHIQEGICSNLSFEEAYRFVEVLKIGEIHCPISVFDPVTKRTIVLPGITPATIQAYQIIKEYGLKLAVVEAIKHGYDLAVQLFLDLEVFQINDILFAESPALFWAAYAGQNSIVKLLLEAGADFSQLTYRLAPIHKAAMHNHVEVVKTLLDAGDDINRRGFEGITPLMMAAAAGATETVKLLLSYPELDIDALDDQRITAYGQAFLAQRFEITELITDEVIRRQRKDKRNLSQNKYVKRVRKYFRK